MTRQSWIVAGTVALLALLLGLGWSARGRFLPVEVGTPAPAFVARDLDGRVVSLAQLRGEVLLLNIWATWCPPCRDEMPSMQRLHQRLGRQGLRIVAVSVDAAPGRVEIGRQAGGDVRGFVQALGLDFTVWHDPSAAVQRAYRTTGIPESFVIDRRGVIVKKVIGATEWDSEANVQLFQRLLGE